MQAGRLAICGLREYTLVFPERLFSPGGKFLIHWLLKRLRLMYRHERALATSLFSVAPFLGPVIGPIVGGFVTQNCGFRWVFWVQFIFAA